MGVAHSKRFFIWKPFVANLTDVLSDLVDGQTKFIAITLDDIGYPLCHLRVVKTNGRFLVSCIEFCGYCYSLDAAKRLRIRNSTSKQDLYSLPVDWYGGGHAGSQEPFHVMCLAYPIINTLVGNPLVEFQCMHGWWGIGAFHAHNALCHASHMSLPDKELGSMDKKAILTSRRIIDATIDGVSREAGRLYFTTFTCS